MSVVLSNSLPAPVSRSDPTKSAWQVPELAAQLGYSGCSLRLGKFGREVCVEKRAIGLHAVRLQRQMVKQQQAQEQAHRSGKLAFIHIPELYDQCWCGDGAYVVRMEYLSFSSCLRFFAIASRPRIDQTMAMLIAYINANLANSPLQLVAGSHFAAKLDAIESALATSGQLSAYSHTLKRVRQRLCAPLLLPVGQAHGDLTLSNMMIASDASQIGLFDFLDGYLESPLIDIAKLRQDTRFHWSLCLAEEAFERSRLEPILAYMDRFLLTHFKHHEWMCHLDLIEAINLLRIVPYVGREPGMASRSHRVHHLLTQALTTLGF